MIVNYAVLIAKTFQIRETVLEITQKQVLNFIVENDF